MLQVLAPIAGSSVTLPRLAQDIDIWVLNENYVVWQRVIRLLSKYRATFSIPKLSEEYKDRSTCLVSADIPREELPVQVIFTKFSSVEALLQSFDMDYIRGACFQGRVSWQVGASHDLRQVLTLYDANVKLKRCCKALAKGFQCPILANDTHILPNMTSSHDMESKDGEKLLMTSVSTLHEMTPMSLDLTNIQITNINFSHAWHGRDQKQGQKPLHKYYHFVVNDAHAFRFVSIRAQVDTIQRMLKGFPDYVYYKASHDVHGDILIVEMSCAGHGKLVFHVLNLQDVHPNLILPVEFASSFWDACEKIRFWARNSPNNIHCEVVDDLEWVRLECLRLSGKDSTTQRESIFYQAYRAFEWTMREKQYPAYAPKQLAWDYQKHLNNVSIRDRLGYVGPDWTCFGPKEPPNATFDTYARAAAFLREMWNK